MTTLQKRNGENLSSGQNFLHHSSDSNEAKPCSAFAVMCSAELDLGQREQKEFHQLHYSERSNLI